MVRALGEREDPLALRIFEQQAMAIGRLFTIAANYSDPDTYFLGGVVETTPKFRQWFLGKVREHTALREEQARVATLALVPDLDMAGARGAAIAALDALQVPVRPGPPCRGAGSLGLPAENRSSTVRRHSAGSISPARSMSWANSDSWSARKPLRPCSMISGQGPRRVAITGVPQARASMAAVAPGSSQEIGISTALARPTSSSLPAPPTVPTQRIRPVLERLHRVQVVAHVAVAVQRAGRVQGAGNSSGGRHAGHRAGHDQRQAQLLADAGGHRLALERGDAAEDQVVLALVGLEPVGGQVDAQVDGAEALGAEVGRGGGELGVGDAVEEHPPAAVEGAVELGVLAQVPVEGLEHRGPPSIAPSTLGPTTSRWSWTRSMSGRSRRVSSTVAVGVGDAHDLGVRAGQAPELAVGEGAAAVVDLDGALLDGAEHDLDPRARSSGIRVARTFSMPP